MKDFFIHTVLALAFILSITASRDDLAYSAIGPGCTGGSATQKVSFVHVGDMHARFDLVEDSYSRVRAFLNKVRLENPYTIFTNAGDDHEKGSVAEQYSSGNAVTEATFAMQLDVRTIGNHDFAWGVDHLLAFSRDPHSMALSSNTRYDGADARGLGSVDYGVLEVGCLRIGFFGMVGMPWNELDEQVALDYLPSLHTTFNYSELARRIVDAHRGEVDLMVMVSHLGSAEDEKVAANVNGVDLVLGGHSHDPPRQQPAWIYSGPLTPNAGSRYKVIIHKGAALNPSLFFPGVNFLSVVFLSETWEVLAKYGADRTAACLFLDTDSPLSIPSCRPGGGGGGSGRSGGSDGGGGCFIAAAAYGSDLDPYVTILRNFRDAFLLTNPLGKSFIAWHYKVSPPIADSVRTSETAKAFVRIILLPAVGFAYLCLNAGVVPSLLIIIFAIAIIWVGIRRIYRFNCTLLYNITLL